jgi:hypothetical protein
MPILEIIKTLIDRRQADRSSKQNQYLGLVKRAAQGKSKKSDTEKCISGILEANDKSPEAFRNDIQIFQHREELLKVAKERDRLDSEWRLCRRQAHDWDVEKQGKIKVIEAEYQGLIDQSMSKAVKLHERLRVATEARIKLGLHIEDQRKEIQAKISELEPKERSFPKLKEQYDQRRKEAAEAEEAGKPPVSSLKELLAYEEGLKDVKKLEQLREQLKSITKEAVFV